MKKVLITLGVLLLLLLASNTALAADISIKTEPEQVTAAGSVTIKITIRNDSDTPMTRIGVVGLGINNPQNVYNLTIAPGESQPFSIPNIGVNADMLGKPQTFSFTWMEGSEQKAQDVSFVIGEPQQAVAAMTATRKVSKSTGKEGESITLTYTLKNPSTVSMTDVTLKDSLAGSSALESPFILEAGGTKTITYDYTLGKDDALSQPTITYTVNSETKSLTIDPETIKITNISLQATVSGGDPTSEGTLFTITLKNDGNQDISKISVTDELGNKVNQDAFTLKAGEERTLTFLVNPDTVRNVAFIITGTDALGQPYENKTRSMEARPYVDPSNVAFTMLVTVPEPLTESGRMKVRFAVQNDSSVEITSAVITEAELGELERREALPQGESIIEKDLRISEPRELQFTLIVKDPSGAEHSYQAQVTAAYMPSTTPGPTESFDVIDPEETEQPAGGSDTLITVLIVLAVLMGVAGIALLVLSIYERKKGNAMPDYDIGGDQSGLPNAPVRGGRARARVRDMDDDIRTDIPSKLERPERPERSERPERPERPVSPAAGKEAPVKLNGPPKSNQRVAVRKDRESVPAQNRQADEARYVPPERSRVQSPQQFDRPEPRYEPQRNAFAQRAREQDETSQYLPADEVQDMNTFAPPKRAQQPYLQEDEQARRAASYAPPARPAQEPERQAYAPPSARPAQEPERQVYTPPPARERPVVNEPKAKPSAPGVRNRVHRVRAGDE